MGNTQLTAVFQDSKGWLWLGGRNGLYRYDGLSFQAVGLPASFSSAISALFELDGRLWVGFRDGAIGFVLLNSAFASDKDGQNMHIAQLQAWLPEEGLPQKPITAFAADSAGGFWVSTYGEGIYCLKNKRIYQFNAADEGLGSDEIYALACDAKGRVWAATDAGISICSMPKPGKKQVRRLTTEDGLPDEIVTALLADKRGNMWIGMQENGVCHYDVFQNKFDFRTEKWPYSAVLNLATTGNKELWVGTEKDGVLRLDLPTNTTHPLPSAHTLRSARIRALLKDREGLLWLLGDKGALYAANIKFGMLEAPSNNAQAVLIDRQHRVWVGNKDGLSLLKNGEKKSVTTINGVFKPQNVISIWESNVDGNIWAGTFDNGVYVVSPTGKVLKNFSKSNGLSDANVLSIAGDDRRVWLATFGGVMEIDLHTQRITRIEELGNGYVYKVFPDSKGRVWFGTDGKGLIALENNRFRHFTQANGKPLKTIYSIAEDLNGGIWFSTERGGVFCYDGQNFRHFGTEQRLHSLSVTGLATDGNGQLIIAYNDGVDVLNPARSEHVTFCDAAIGAPNVEVNLNALCRDAQGNVWLGTQQGIMRVAAFDESFMDDPQPGIVSVSNFSEPIDFLSKSIFPHHQNYLVFNFTGLWYTAPESVRYRYRLEGFDLDWTVSKDHVASYPNLPPGRYTFRVQTSEHGNFEGVPEATWQFTIEPPLWARWWFILPCIVAASGIFFMFVKNREARLQREERLQREKVESQFAALKSQINPHFLFNNFNTLITIIEENPTMAVAYLEHLSDFYRSIIAYREKDFISLQEEMDLVRNFDFLLKKRYEDGFRLVEHLNGETGLVMPLALQMLVENAVKHNVISATKPLIVEIFSEKGGYVVVRNNVQPKIKPEPSTHFGLHSLVKRYQLLGEKPVLVEKNDAFFIVKIPLKQ